MAVPVLRSRQAQAEGRVAREPDRQGVAIREVGGSKHGPGRWLRSTTNWRAQEQHLNTAALLAYIGWDIHNPSLN
jgi:histidinol-phosphate/aromatic aminotransferase/cobyric acid decarboxylase-like protein